MVEEGQRDPEFETILDMVDPNRFDVLLSIYDCFELKIENCYTVNLKKECRVTM